MGKISLLDCTLRDGGNVNNCKFGSKNISDIIRALAEAGIGFIEIGFLRDELYDPDRSVYARCEDIMSVISGVDGVKFTAMIEQKEDISKQFPLEKVARLKDAGLDFIRVTVWEWKLEDHLEYCKRIKEMGIEISIQPTAVVEYTDKRFMQLLEMANEIRPFSFYLVDTWGTELPGKIRHLAEMANQILSPEIALGYHGHNNKMQGMACFETVLGMEMSRQILVDGSIGGMGKGPGNFQTEVIAELLNEERNSRYDVDRLCLLYANNVSQFLRVEPWGYSLYYFIGSRYVVHQNISAYFHQMQYGEDVYLQFVKSLKGREKNVFNREFTENRLKELGLK